MSEMIYMTIWVTMFGLGYIAGQLLLCLIDDIKFRRMMKEPPREKPDGCRGVIMPLINESCK